MDFKELTHNLKHKFEHLLNKEETHEGETCQDHYLHHEDHEHEHEQHQPAYDPRPPRGCPTPELFLRHCFSFMLSRRRAPHLSG